MSENCSIYDTSENLYEPKNELENLTEWNPKYAKDNEPDENVAYQHG